MAIRRFLSNALFQLAGAVRAAGGFLVDFALAEGAKTRRLLGGLGLFFLLLQVVELIDKFHNEEQANGDGNKIDDRLKEQAVRNFGRSDHPLHVLVIVLLRDERKKRHNNAVYERVYDCGERRADNHTNGKVDDVAFECKGLEFIPHFLHDDFLPFRLN